MATHFVSIEPVVKAVTIACTPEKACRFFTADFGMWWPAATHSVVAYESQFKDQPAGLVFEPHVGGRIFERTRAGTEHAWGTVLVWQPPTRVKFSFHPGRDARQAQTVEVRFSEVAEGTLVTLTHSGWENLTVDAQQARDSYHQGWERVFVGAYSEHVRSGGQSGA